MRSVSNLGRVALVGWIAVVSAASLFGQASVLTWHNDNARTGQNLFETILTPANVNVSSFQRLFTLSVDGKVDAQPLYVPSLTISGSVHNVLYVATEHDSVYAFDADNGTLLKQVTLLGTGEVPSDDRGCGHVTPEMGVTATPVIDLSKGPHGTIYLVAMSKLSGNYIHKIHALDLTTLGEEFGGPFPIAATYPMVHGAFSVTGDEKVNLSDTFQTFLPYLHKHRGSLLLSNGVVYTNWSSHCDQGPYTGWVIGYDATTLAQVSVLNVVPNGQRGGIWESGAAPAADSDGNIFLLTGNGKFDTTFTPGGLPANNDYGNAFVKISTAGGTQTVVDYFTMGNTADETLTDKDFGSGGVLLLPPLNDSLGNPRQLAVGAGKDTNMYVVDRTNLGKFHSPDAIYQELSHVLGSGIWSSPAWFNGNLYFGPTGGPLMKFPFTNGTFAFGGSSSHIYGYPGGTPAISANGTTHGIVWVAENTDPAVLHAYDAANLSTELYNSNLAAANRDHFGTGNKYIVPTIVNGKVYVGTTSGVGVFGLKPVPFVINASAGTPQNQLAGASFSTNLGATVLDSTNTPVSGALVTFTAPNSGATGTFANGTITTQATTNTFGVATATVFTANATTGAYNVTASVSGVVTPANFSLTNQPPPSGGTLAGSVTNSTAAANLTSEGTTDWRHWGEVPSNRKTGGVGLSDYTLVGGGSASLYSNDPRTITWSDGTPALSSPNNHNGIYTSSVGHGFSLTAPADATVGTLIVHVGGWNSGGTLTAHLSDGTAPDYVNTTPTAGGQYDGNYTLTYAAASAGQTLTVTWQMASGSGNVTLNAAALNKGGGPPPPPPTNTITATSGTPQSATVSTAFALALQATVKDPSNNPVSGASVTFTAPGSGAGGTFAGGLATMTASTNASGVATSSTFTANGTAGGYTVVASVSGIPTPANFSLTNTAVVSPGSLSGIVNSSAAPVNLTGEGTTDWEHWGESSLTRKSGVTAKLSDYSVVGGGGISKYNDDPRPITWTDGTPTSSSTNNKNGVYISSTGHGFSLTAPADTTARTLNVHVGGWNSGATLTAHLSDGSHVDFTDTTPTASGQYDRNYTLTYAAGAASQTLTVTWKMASGSGNVTLNAAALQ